MVQMRANKSLNQDHGSGNGQVAYEKQHEDCDECQIGMGRGQEEMKERMEKNGGSSVPEPIKNLHCT